MFSTESRLDTAKTRLASLEKEREELTQELKKMESPSYTEAQIRNQLGLAKEGEIVLVFPEDDLVRRLAPSVATKTNYQLPDPYWRQWLHLFL